MGKKDSEFNQLANDYDATKASGRFACNDAERAATDQRRAAVLDNAAAMVDGIVRGDRQGRGR